MALGSCVVLAAAVTSGRGARLTTRDCLAAPSAPRSSVCGDVTMVFLTCSELTLVSVSRTGEDVSVLRRQLEFMYGQIVFILTQKVRFCQMWLVPTPAPFSPSFRPLPQNGEKIN